MRRDNGNGYFYQWELNQRLIVTEDCTMVQFDNGTQKTALVCQVFEENGVRLADVPNILLQTAGKLHAYAWDGANVVSHVVFDVIARVKPDDYVYTQTEVMDYRKFTELRAQGRSAKYTLTSSGWKRVLNIIRATNGTLQLGVAKATGGIHAVQALGINFTGNVNFPSVGIDTEPVIYQVYDHEFGDNNSEDETKHARITQVRIGYPASNTEYPESDGSVNYKTNPVNCYVDVYVDFNADSGNAQLNMNFSGFADSHNCTPITEETNAQDTGMYGETLQYKTFDVSRESTIYMPDGSITANKVHAGNMPYELLESTNENPVILRNLPNGIYYITGNGYYCEGKEAAFTKGLYIVKRLSDKSDVVRICPENTGVLYYTITDNSYTNNAIYLSYILENADRIDRLFAEALHPEVKTDDMTQPVGVDGNGALWTAPTGGGGSSENIQPIYSVEITDEAGVAEIKIPFADYDDSGTITNVHKYKDISAYIRIPNSGDITNARLIVNYFTRCRYDGEIIANAKDFSAIAYQYNHFCDATIKKSNQIMISWIDADKGTLPLMQQSSTSLYSANSIVYPTPIIPKDENIANYVRGIWIKSGSTTQLIPAGTKIYIFGNEIKEVAQ